MSNEVDLDNEPVKHLLFILAVPAIVSQLVNALYNMVDRMYIGHIADIGATALTGVGVCFPIIMIVSAFAYLVGMGGAPRASIFMGRGDRKTAEKILGNCFSALLAVAAVLTAIVLIFQRPLLYMFGASDNTIGYAMDYMTIYAVGTVFVQLTLGLNAFISAQGFSKISMMTVVIGAISNIVLDPVFIFAFDMGVRGAALATVISQAISAVLCFNSSLLKYGGDLAVGTMTILSSVMQFAMLPLQGFTQGGQPIISFNYGAGNLHRVKEAFKLQTMCCLGYSCILWALVQLFPSIFVAVFTDDPELAEMSCWALRIYMAMICIMGLQTSCQQTFVAFGNAKTSSFLAIFRKIIVLIPLIYILPVFMEDNVLAVFLAEPVADTIAVATTVTMFWFTFRKMLREGK